ncbi:MAG: phosphoribosylamine--glycine ligase [Mogibacterium sp.]|nr:phosphoribosylamine--glycine ligase [Mogibacterium sp.]
MKVAVIGGGGREHAIIRKLKQSRDVSELYALPGNGGIAEDATCVNIKATDLDGIVAWCTENAMDYVVVAPDDPLVMGLVDLLNEQGIPCFGPNKAAAIIEGSKAFSKELMKKYGIPTARYEIFSDMQEAIDYVNTCRGPIVVKADGLALGKGVIIADTREEAVEGIRTIMQERKFGASGDTIVIEEFLEGPEVTVLSFTDGKVVRPMLSSMDHKRALDGDRGLNTGGMGVIAPNPYYTDEIAAECMERIFLPTIEAMNQEGRTFRGCLYFGLMITENGPKVIEYNSRFGDPETQVVLPMLEGDLFEIMQATTNGTLADVDFSFKDGCACCVVAASSGYPEHYEKGFEITLPKEHDTIYIAGSRLADKDGRTVQLTNGGRVLGVTETAPTLAEAIDKAYATMQTVHFDNMFYRKDIGKRALAAK